MIALLSLLLLTTVCGYAQTQDSDEIVFPGEANYRRLGARAKTPPQERPQVPLELLQRLNDVEDVAGLLNVVEGDLSGFYQLSNRFAGSERSGATLAKPARCMPTLQAVELKPTGNDSSSAFYIPQCTRVMRCGGCCSHSLLSCQPTLTETLTMQVMVTRYHGGDKLQLDGKELVLVEQHLKCKCDCVLKPQDCNVFQEYKKDECRCVCTNIDEKKKCEKYNMTKLWDPRVCECRCRDVTDCTTGLVYDHNKCRCMPVPLRRRFAELNSTRERTFTQQERYDVDSMSVLPIQNPKTAHTRPSSAKSVFSYRESLT